MWWVDFSNAVGVPTVGHLPVKKPRLLLPSRCPSLATMLASFDIP